MTTNKVTQEHEENTVKQKGVISAYQHEEDLEFVSHNNPDDPSNGYFRIPANSNVVVHERHMKNLIVNLASVFMAKRMRPGTSWGAGIGYLELGTGVGTGTTQVPQPESASQTALRVPLIRKAITSWTCLDSSGAPTASDTNVVQYTTVFTEIEAVGAIVEMGMFGGDATITTGSGQMFNYKVFPVINKDNNMQLTIVWKVTY